METIDTFLQNFHFLRPAWFWALIPGVALYWLLRKRQAGSSNWERSIDPQLLSYLLEKPGGGVSRSPLFLLMLAWILATVALAGPVWRKIPQPVHEREDALVVIFDLTGSMYAEDVQPNRLVRARRKLLDLLTDREEGITGLVVFAGDAHTVSPLTDDANTIAEMIPAIAPDIMPAPGSELTPALQLAVQLFEDAGVASGRILIMTDEIRDLATAQRTAREFRHRYPVSVLAVGTPQGAPVPAPDGNGYLKDSSGVLVIPKVDMGRLADFAANAGGRFSRMSLTDEDLEYLLTDRQPLLEEGDFLALERDFDVWMEEGPWLLLLLLPLAALAFRRGWVWSIALVCLLPVSEARASFWDDLWQRRDQQAMRALESGEPDRAAELFDNSAWKGTAEYRAEDYEEAAKHWQGIDTSDGFYNRGNALAHQQAFEEAIAAYDRALELDSSNEDAAYNKALLEELLKQQEQQQQQNQQGDEGDQSQQEPEGEQTSGDDQQQGASQPEDSQEETGDEQQDEGQQDQRQEEEGDEQEAEARRAAEEEAAAMDEEEQQALQQWLRRVPDDPGGLLRRKFQLQHEERGRMRISTENDETADW